MIRNSHCEFTQNSSEECSEGSRNSNTLVSLIYVQISLLEEKTFNKDYGRSIKFERIFPMSIWVNSKCSRVYPYLPDMIDFINLKRMVTHRFLLLSFAFSIFLEHLALFKNICREKIEIFRNCKPFKIWRKLQSLLLFMIHSL